MTDYSDVYNELSTVNDETYLVQDGELFEEPMIRNVEELLEVERDNVQKMYGEKQGEYY